jgi:CHAD domain-containing protein
VLQLKPDLADRLGRRLKKVRARLGAVRELDVLAALVDELQSSGEWDPQVLRRVAASIAGERAQARERFQAKLPARELEQIARKLKKIGGDLRDTGPSRGWQWAVDARVSRRAAMVVRTLDAAGSMYMPERLHDVRIALKKFRYALEVAGEAAGEKPSPDIRALKRRQDTLGRLHDLQVLIDRVRGIQTTLSAPDVTMWRKIDLLTAALEDECRRLHAKFVHQQSAIRAICDRVRRAAGAAPQTRRAMAG